MPHRDSATPLGLVSLPLLALLAVAASCAQPDAEAPFEVAVRWGVTGASTLPADVTAIDLLTCTQLDGEPEVCESFSCSLDALTLMLADGAEAPNCRTSAGTESFGDSPVLVRRNLANGARVRFQLRGLGADGETIAHVGQAGPFVLAQGERRFVEVVMYPTATAMPLPGLSLSRLMHTASYLPDGRILVAGGFDTVQQNITCPVELALPAETVCHALTATSSALAFDVSTRKLEPIRSPMLEARAGHTATTLPDGRILLAGGAASAILAMIPQGSGAVNGYRAEIFPELEDGTAGALASFEIFDAFLDVEEVDVDRDGDLGAGRFFGTAGSGNPGTLNYPRFLHAAAAVPATPGRVLLVGGLGSVETSESYEVFDADKSGGFGVYQGAGNRLSVARPLPGAVGLGNQVWIFGGRAAANNDELSDVWSDDPADPNGTLEPATAVSPFPSSNPAEMQDHPEYGLLRPTAVALDASRALIVGWYGALCEVGMSAPLFDGSVPGTELCQSPMAPATRSFTFSSERGLATPTEVRLHAFGAAAITSAFAGTPSTRRVVVTGGIANTSWGAQSAVDVFTGAVDASGQAARLMGTGISLQRQRLFHTSTGIPGWGVVTMGGISFGTIERMVLENEVEILYLQQPPR